MARRPVKPAYRKPSFFWQGVLILAPVLVLAKLGVFTLSQDKRMLQREAELRAQDVAEEAVQAIWSHLQDTNEPAAVALPTWLAAGRSPQILGDSNLVVPSGTVAEKLYSVRRVKRLELDPSGHLMQPPPYEEAPAPQSLDSSTLSPEQRQLWSEANLQESGPAWRKFLDSTPPTNFIVDARYKLGCWLMRSASHAEAVQVFGTITNRSPYLLNEAGLPYATLARVKLFRAQQLADRSLPANEQREAGAALVRDLLEHPSALTAEVLRRGAIPEEGLGLPEEVLWPAEAEWRDQQEARRIYAAAHFAWSESNAPVRFPGTNLVPMAHRPAILWVHLPQSSPVHSSRTSGGSPSRNGASLNPSAVPPLTPGWSNVMNAEAAERGRRTGVAKPGLESARLSWDEAWLLTRAANESNIVYYGRSRAETEALIKTAVEGLRLPRYLDLSVRLAGEEVVSSNHLQVLRLVSPGKGSGQDWVREIPAGPLLVLATASHRVEEHPVVSVSAHLVSPDLLFAQQEQRAIWFKLLIGAAALASIVGFFAAYHAFRKQLRLAEMKSNFVSSVSHELRAPIASVRLMAEGLERGKISEPAKQREYFRFITQECRRLSAMIENVLDFARIEQGRKEYDFEPTDVGALVQTTVKLMEPYAEERGVRLRVDGGELRTGPEAPATDQATHATEAGCASPSACGEGRGDEERRVANLDGQAMQQALVNLIDNAIKHSPAGREVVIGLHFQSATLSLAVADLGPGIPDAEHARIFERFYRLGSELRRETPGVGIGLSIVKHIVEAHGGQVRVKSEVGKGSCFTIELPLNHEDTKVTRRERK